MSSACRKEARAKVIRAVVGQLAWQGSGHLCHLCCDFRHCLQEAPQGVAARGLARGYEENDRCGNGWFLTLQPRKERMPRTRAGKDSSTAEPWAMPRGKGEKGRAVRELGTRRPLLTPVHRAISIPRSPGSVLTKPGCELLSGLPALPLLDNPPPNNHLFSTAPD